MTRSKQRNGAWAGIRKGLPEIFDRHLGLEDIDERSPHFKNRASMLELSKGRPNGLSIIAMLKNALEAIRNNMKEGVKNRHSKKKEPGSVQNWRCNQNTEIDDDNYDPEIILERAVAGAKWDGWANQIPVASGIMSSSADRRTAIDLACRRKDGGIDLIELKWKSDTPLYAALEIVGYGLVLLAYKEFLDCLFHAPNSSILEARRIGLRVLAPAKFYRGCSLEWLEIDINSALRKITPSGLKMDFAFRDFPTDFEIPFASGAQVKDEANFNNKEPLLRRAFINSDPGWTTRR